MSWMNRSRFISLISPHIHFPVGWLFRASAGVMLGSIKRFSTVATAITLTASASAWAQDLDFGNRWGLTLQNGFVISPNANFNDEEGRAVYDRIGFIESGTIIEITGVCPFVNGTSEENEGIYCPVRSETGVSGLMLARQFEGLEAGRTYGYVSDRGREVPLRNQQGKKLYGNISRNAAPILELNEPIDPLLSGSQKVDFVHVTSAKMKPLAGDNQTISYADFLKALTFFKVSDDEQKIHAYRRPRATAPLKSSPVKVWNVQAGKQRSTYFSRKVFSDLQWSVSDKSTQTLLKEALDFIGGSLDKLRCQTSGEVNLSSGFDLFGNAAKLSGKVSLFEKGRFFDAYTDFAVDQNDRLGLWVFQLDTIKCVDGGSVVTVKPELVERTTIVPFKAAPILPAMELTPRGVQDSSLKTPEGRDWTGRVRMFTIASGDDYRKAKQYIVKRLRQSESFKELQAMERELVVTMALTRLSEYSRSDAN